MNTAAEKTSVNRLTGAMTYKLCNVLSTLNQAGGITVDSSWASLAEYCSKMLETKITDNNIKGAFDILELTLPQALPSKEQQLENRVKALEKALRKLCLMLNAPVFK